MAFNVLSSKATSGKTFRLIEEYYYYSYKIYLYVLIID